MADSKKPDDHSFAAVNEAMLRKIAAALDKPYEELTHEFLPVNDPVIIARCRRLLDRPLPFGLTKPWIDPLAD